MRKLKVGSKVTWKSQSRGYYTIKEGTIIAVVPAGEWATKYGYKPNGGPPGVPRNHETYVVQVGNRTYWPMVSKWPLLSG